MIRKNILISLFLFSVLAAFGQIEVEEVSITNIEDINSGHNEFLAIPYGDGIMFTSSNGETFGVKEDKCNTCDYFQNLRFAPKRIDSDCGFQPPVAIVGEVKSKYNYGTPTFSSTGSQMILSQNYDKSSGENGKTLKLVAAQKSDQNAWVNVTELPFNLKGYETTHPALSPDGQKLYFSSNRPEGQGGMDLYVSIRQGDNWGTPQNLGAAINTAGNEIFPVIAADGKLYFSSNRPGGLGQLDIFVSEMKGGTWSNPENVGAPFNSPADDIGLVTLEDGESGYLTSNRGGGKGGDDIYCWKINKVPVLLAVEDATNSNRLQNAMVKIVGPNATIDYTTDANGNTEPEITFRRNYTIMVEKEGYEPWSKEVAAAELAAVKEYIVPLIPRTYQLTGDVLRIGSNVVVPGSKVILHNLTTGEKKEVIADESGKFNFSIRCFEDYELIAYKDDLESEKVALPATEIDCSSSTPSVVTLRIPNPVPTAPVCACHDAGILSLPFDATPQVISALGSRPQFGNAESLDAAGFYKRLQKRYDRSKRDAAYLNDLFKAMGYPNGFEDISEYSFTETTIPNGMVGNMGYSRNRSKYVQLDARNDRYLAAFRVSSVNGCDVHFMKTCGNVFFFCTN